jgi:hypothetical protein
MAADVESDIKDWSTTASSNKPTGSTSISTNLDDNLREIQAAVRQAFEASPWFDYGHTYTYSDADTFTIGTPSTDQTSVYHAGRRVKVVVTGGTYYGYINSSSFATNTTTVNVTLEDSGALDAGLSAVWVGPPVTGNPLNLNSAPRVVGCDCKNNSSTPNTQFDLDADYITLRNPTTGHCFTIANPGSAITNNISTAGPAANGRDQAGAFSNSSWVHFYWIWNGTTLATISSATAPPTGPTLPSGYTHWAYAGADYLDSGGALKKVRIKGSMVFYEIFARLLNSTSVGTTEANLDMSASIPPNALSSLININAGIATNTSGGAGSIAEIRVVTGLSFIITVVHASTASLTIKNSTGGFVPNIGQNLIYLFTSDINPTNIAQRQLAIDVCGFTIPNGGE